MSYYFKIMGGENDVELQAIAISPTAKYIEAEEIIVEKELGRSDWWFDEITQAEFETYQAFGIREIKLS